MYVWWLQIVYTLAHTNPGSMSRHYTTTCQPQRVLLLRISGLWFQTPNSIPGIPCQVWSFEARVIKWRVCGPFRKVGPRLGILWRNQLFCRATVAFASSNYINAGLAFIWIRLFIQLWTMEKQMSVVSFLVITGAGAHAAPESHVRLGLPCLL